MPWYSAPPIAKEFGWHWTMNKFNVDQGLFASKYHPAIGPYDSRDPFVIEYQLLTMKLAGIDGLILDWYGIDQLWDYPDIHESSKLVFAKAAELGMKVAVMYEDQTMRNLIGQKVLTDDQAIGAGKRTMRWVSDNWMNQPNYLKLEGKPALFVFGPQFFKAEDWSTLLAGIDVSFYTLHHRRGMAVGAFDWPLPKGGWDGCKDERNGFFERAKDWNSFVPVAFPRFDDIYHEAGLHESYGAVPDNEGETFRKTLAEGLQGNALVVQIATWNDWGEGTQIEPSREYGTRDLSVIQDLRRKYVDSKFANYKDDLSLPESLLKLRKGPEGKFQQAILDQISTAIARGDLKAARLLIARINAH